MTEQEAIEVITEALEQSENIIVELTNIKEIADRQQKVGEYYANLENCVKEMDACKVAINALEEIQKYRAIGTPEECRAAVEKQKAKKPKQQGIVDSNGKFHTWNGINGKPYLLCPNCGTNLCCEMPYDKKPKYCDDCGQKLDWSDKE